MLVLDTSAWMGAALPNRPNATLMDLARASALGWLRAVPAADRVLLVRADALATPATPGNSIAATWRAPFSNRSPAPPPSIFLRASSSPASCSSGSGSLPGEIVYAGPGRISTREAEQHGAPQHSRVPRARRR